MLACIDRDKFRELLVDLQEKRMYEYNHLLFKTSGPIANRINGELDMLSTILDIIDNEEV